MTPPFKLGLTGSIGMGKSTTAAFFAAEGIPVWDADNTVRQLYAQGGEALAPIAALFPGSVRDGSVSREIIRDQIAADPTRLNKLESIVHPLVAAERRKFLAVQTADLVVLDIPLLFENGSEAELDATLLVTAPAAVQHTRVLARPGMTEAVLATLLARQMPDAEKRRRADHVVETLDLPSTQAYVKALIAYIRSQMKPRNRDQHA